VTKKVDFLETALMGSWKKEVMRREKTPTSTPTQTRDLYGYFHIMEGLVSGAPERGFRPRNTKKSV
jgi:hypothetical protein